MKGRVEATEVQAPPLSLGLFWNMKKHNQSGRYIWPGSQSHYHMRIYHALGETVFD